MFHAILGILEATMLECLILGDSIAVGTGMVRRDCVTAAQGGISTPAWNRKYRDMALEAKTVVISLGSNDLSPLGSEREAFEALRSRVSAARVLWILPACKPRIAALLGELAESWGDDIIPIPHLSDDGVHPSPRGYRELGHSF